MQSGIKTTSFMLPYLVVGQGIAGLQVAYQLYKRSLPFRVIDRSGMQTASLTAAGLVNPVTGRRMVKSWRIDELLPVAREIYTELQDLLGPSILQPRTIYRALFSPKEVNDWQSRTAQDGYDTYLTTQSVTTSLLDTVQDYEQIVRINQALQIDLVELLLNWKKKLDEENLLIEANFDFSQLQVSECGIDHAGEMYSHVIFCEGSGVLQNPYFGHLPWRPAKGEALIVRLHDYALHDIVKHKVFIAPLGDDTYWIGATLHNRFDTSAPTPSGLQDLLERLRLATPSRVEVLSHRAALRPATKDRRPIIGRHPGHPELVLFNGMGTKGTSLAPFFARQLVDHLVADAPLDPEVDIRRFW